MQFWDFLKLNIFHIEVFSFSASSQKEFHGLNSIFTQGIAKQQRNKTLNRQDEEVFNETLLPSLAHRKVFLDERQVTNYL